MISEYIKPIEDFFSSPFFTILGGISALLVVGGFLYSVYLVLKGILPVLYRVGMALSKRKVAIFATNEFCSLKNMLVDSKILNARNIMQINKNEINKASKANLFLVHWDAYQELMSEILRLKTDSIALVVYAPQSEGRIENQEILNNINSQRNSIIVNFRGRLLNDIFVSLITAHYE